MGRATCLHCDVILSPQSKTPAWLRNTIMLVGGASLSMTLAACYGDPCAHESCAYNPYDGGPAQTCDDPSTDLDLDGHCGEFDCDEENASVNSSAADPLGDGVDTNCDGIDGVDVNDENEADAGSSDG